MATQLGVARDELGAALAGLRPLEGSDESERQAELDAAREAGRSDYDLVDPATKRLADDVIEPLIVTAESGEVDFFLQFRRERPGGVTILAASSIAQGDRFSQAVPRVLQRVLDKLPVENPLVQGLTLNVAAEDGVTWHRFDPVVLDAQQRADQLAVLEANTELSDEVRNRRLARIQRGGNGADFFGGPPVFHVGLGRKHVWAVVGAEGSLVEGQAAVTAVAANAGRLGPVPDTPIRGALNVSGWFPDASDDMNDDMLRAKNAFLDGTDRLTMTLARTPTGGVRLRFVFGEGFVRFLALSITDRFDEAQL